VVAPALERMLLRRIEQLGAGGLSGNFRIRLRPVCDKPQTSISASELGNKKSFFVGPRGPEVALQLQRPRKNLRRNPPGRLLLQEDSQPWEGISCGLRRQSRRSRLRYRGPARAPVCFLLAVALTPVYRRTRSPHRARLRSYSHPGVREEIGSCHRCQPAWPETVGIRRIAGRCEHH
jgi:hypothetical protein